MVSKLTSSLPELLARQKDIIQALFYLPDVLAKYVHYRGSKSQEFEGLSIQVPPVPFIPYNDNSICCLLDRIEGYQGAGACRTLSVTTLGRGGKVGTPYIIRDTDGTVLVVKLSDVGDLHSRYDIEPPTSIKDIDKFGFKQCISNTPINLIRYIASDEFTNETLIAYILNLLADKLDLPRLFVKHYVGAICSDSDGTHGLNIMENCDLGPLSELPGQHDFLKYTHQYDVGDLGRRIQEFLVEPDIIFQILVQVTAGLHMLQNYAGFVSGDLKAANVLVKSTPIDTEYKGVKLKAPFTCKIADYGKSSCMLTRENNTALRFYNESTLANIYLAIHPFSPDVTKTFYDEYYYTIGSTFVSQLYTRMWHMGVPFYRSFDYYTLLVSMLTHPSFYYMFFSNDKLRQTFWTPIWANEEESDTVIKRIRQFVISGTGKSINDSINSLKNIHLKCDAVNIVMNRILSVQ